MSLKNTLSTLAPYIMRQRLFALAVVLVTLSRAFHVVEAFYLPGVAPQDFHTKDEIKIKVNKLSSSKNLPYEYYSLYQFCKPPQGIHKFVENLGEVLRGDRIENSVYTGQFRANSRCNVACGVGHKLSEKEEKMMKSRISDEYKVNMILDNLPVGMVRVKKMEQGKRAIKTYERGFPIGIKEEGDFYVNNHLVFKILYHEDPDASTSRIVGFEVQPYSVKNSVNADGKLNKCDPKSGMQPGVGKQKIDDGKEIIFSYDIVYEPSDILWASRWDTYLTMTDKQVHWFSIINSLMIVFFLTGMIAIIMLRTLRRDISRYNDLETVEEAAEETGWKLVHGDVFRPPPYSSWLAVAVGTGTQILSMTVVTMSFAALGFLSPANRGGLTTAGLFLFVFSGVFNGYSSARLYKLFKLTNWRAATLRSALTFPGIVSLVFLFLNFMVWGQKSSGAVPFGTMIALIFLWFGISVPLTFLGSYVGYKKEAIDEPVRTNKIPRQVPEQPWYMGIVTSMFVGGILPFGAVFMELFFILGSVWQQEVYYLFGILAIVFIILVITCAEITIVLAYFHLCAEDYKWWWRAFITSGSSALYMFGYSLYYFVTRLDITKLVPALMYFGYMFLASLAFFALTGTVGFYACFWFVHKIYGSVKID